MQLARFLGFAGPRSSAEDPAALGYLRDVVETQATVVQNPSHVCCAPVVCTSAGVTLALAGDAFFGADRRLVDASVAPAILEAYRRSRKGFLRELNGSFALAVFDANHNSVLLAVDRMGVERLAYATRGDSLVFSSSAEAIAHLPGTQARLRNQALFDYLLLHMVPAPDTVYEGVHKLRAGTCAIFERARLNIERYWTPGWEESARGSVDELEAELHRELLAAVKACRPDFATGAFLSGGLDSSTVAGVLGEASGQPARTFSIGFGHDAYDELRYARIAGSHFGFRASEYQVTADDIVTAFPEIATAYDEPFGNSSAVPTLFCARLARRHGVMHLLAGDGGDELFAGNERYARQQVFEAYQVLPSVLRRWLVEPLARMFDAEQGLVVTRKFRSYVDQARIPLPERLESWNYIYRTDLKELLTSDFLASVDPRAPFRNMTEVFGASNSSSVLNRMLFFDWQYTLSDNDLRKVGTMCALAGVKVSYPMLDQRVVDLSLRVPPALKMRGRELRTFYKRAMRTYLPAEIIAKTKHGFGLPFGAWLRTHAGLADLIYSHVSDLKSRGFIQPKFLDDLLNTRHDDHPDYLGTAIWDLAMLECWLKHHPAVRPASLDRDTNLAAIA